MTTPHRSPLLIATALDFAYSTRPVLHDVAIELFAGQVVALIGPNGSGKSTLIKLLCGLLNTEAQITVRDLPLHQWHRRLLARTVAYLPQSPTYEPADRVADVLRLGRACYWTAFGLETEHDLAAVARITDLLELNDLVDRRMDQLSGGQRQRVFIGRCLVQEPAILFLDEPNTYLDLKHQVDLLKLLQTLAHDHGLCVLMASHDINLAGAFADQLILLSDGRITARGRAAEVLQPDLISRAYGLDMTQIPFPEHPLLFPKLRP
ncbi:MAG TPA: ABC transporter ATP-binding protein [Chloroflexota bacterium]|nr:ABC transporter ATP-binding protein [Chloroflexota bacterium]